MASPDIPQLSADLKSRIWPWSLTNMDIMSQFEDDGQWHIGDDNLYWYFTPCFAALAATMYRFDTTLMKYRDIAIRTVEAGFSANQNTPFPLSPKYIYNATTGYPTSLFVGLPSVSKIVANFDGGPWGTPDVVGSDENGTIETIASFCWVLDELYSSGGIGPSKAREWMAKLKRAADWLIDFNGNPIWYTNGNYVAHQCLAYGHLAKLCRMLNDKAGWVRYSQTYELSIQTLIYPFGNNPPASTQWANYGYTVDIAGTGSTGTGVGPVAAILTVGGTVSDGSTESGHLTESQKITIIPGVTNTFDGVYAQLQMDVLATLFLVNRDWRVNYLLNACWNKLEPITDFSTYTITTTGGSRNPGVSVRGWTGGYQNVIALLGRRQSNRTNITNANCLGAWDNQIATNLTNNGNNQISLLQSSQARQYRIAIATSLHACYQADKKLS